MRMGRYRWPAGIALAAVMVLAMAAPAMAASSVTVNAQVEPQAYSIALDDGSSLDYGALDVGEYGVPLDSHVITLRNIGTADVKVDMIGSSATNGSATWSLSDSGVGADQFAWTMADLVHLGNVFALNSSTAVTLYNGLTPGSSLSFNPALYMPSSTTGSGHYSWTGTIYASAAIE